MLKTYLQKIYEEITQNTHSFDSGIVTKKDEKGILRFDTFLYLSQSKYFEIDKTCETFNQKNWKKQLNEEGFPTSDIQLFLKDNGFQKVIEQDDLVPFQSEDIDIFLTYPIEGYWLQGDNGNYYMLISVGTENNYSSFFLISLGKEGFILPLENQYLQQDA